MGTTDKGVLIFNEWFEAMESLGPREYKKLMNAMYRYQILGEEPPEFHDKTLMVSKIIFKCLKQRVTQARYGKRSAEYRKKSIGVNPIIDELLQKRSETNSEEPES